MRCQTDVLRCYFSSTARSVWRDEKNGAVKPLLQSAPSIPFKGRQGSMDCGCKPKTKKPHPFFDE
jgi:hypothetical protein